MLRPGVNVTTRDANTAQGAPTDTGVWFAAGATERGPVDRAVLVTSMGDVGGIFGDRVAYSPLTDSLETFFKEGGTRAYVARVVGPAPTIGTLTLKDMSAGAGLNTLRVDAAGPGAYSARLAVQIVAGAAPNSFVIDVTLDGVLVETSGDLASPTEAAAWSATSAYVKVTDLASASAAPNNNPRVLAATALSAGADDHAAITDAQRTAALALFTADLGPGQVSVPGGTTDAIHVALLAHANATNRTALLDGPDTADVAVLAASVIATVGAGAERAAMFAPQATIPGVVPGTTRLVPPSAVVAGLIARADAAFGTNVPAAGPEGESRFALGVSRQWTDAERTQLNEAGVDVLRSMFGAVRLYGYRTISAEPKWRSLADQRLRMEIENRANILGEGFMFARIDGKGRKVAEWGGALTGMLVTYFNRGDLYGTTPEEAFTVDVGPQVNTPATIAAEELHAVLGLRMSPFAEAVFIEIAKVPVTEAL